MTTKERDRRARGPNPRARVAPPQPGERCPRCHSPANGMRGRPCLLCNPDAVPPQYRTDL